VRSLGQRALSVAELRSRLKLRAEKAGDVDEVLSRVREYGYLDDRRFAESYASARLEGEGFGRWRVLRDLRRKRVAPQVAEQAVQRIYQETNETELIEQFLKRKFRKVRLAEHLADPKHLASAYRRLRLAGFAAGPALRVLRRYSASADELEAVEEPGDGQDGPPEPGAE
jgi:regulatory protein